MRSTKLRQKVLAGLLCASMVFQSMSIGTFASEDASTVQVQSPGSEEDEPSADSPVEAGDGRDGSEEQPGTDSKTAKSEETTEADTSEVWTEDISKEISEEETSNEETSNEDTSNENASDDNISDENTSESEAVTTNAEQEETETVGSEEESEETEEAEETETPVEEELEEDEGIMLLEDAADIPTETEETDLRMSVSAEKSLDNMGDSLYLHINGLDNNLLTGYNWGTADEIIYRIVKKGESPADRTATADYGGIRYLSDREAILELAKSDGIKNESELTVEIIHKYIEKKEVEVTKPSGGDSTEGGDGTGTGSGSDSGDDTTPPESETVEVEITHYMTVAKNDITLAKDKILYAVYNPVNGKLNLSMTSGLSGSIVVTNADESVRYEYKETDHTIIDRKGEAVKLDKAVSYIVKVKDGENVIDAADLIWGVYQSRIPMEETPATVRVYRPGSFDPVFTYTVQAGEKIEKDNGTSYYFFSETFLNAPELSIKDEVYNIDFLGGNGNIIGSLSNVVLAEDKWDRTYKIVVNGVEVDKKQKVNLQLSSTTYNTAKITIENALEEPEITFTNATVAECSIQKGSTDTTYIATLTAKAVGSASVTIKVGDIEESFAVEVVGIAKIKEINFNDKPYDKAKREKDITIAGINKLSEIEITLAPRDAIGSGETIVVETSDPTVVRLDRIIDLSEAVVSWEEDDTEVRETLPRKCITLRTLKTGTATVTIYVSGSEEQAKRLTCNVTVTGGVFSQAQQENLKKGVGILYAATNVCNKLGDVQFPESQTGWSWVNPEIELQPDSTIKFYAATCKKESYTAFTTLIPVAVTKVTGAYITGDKELTTGRSGSYQMHLQLTGYNIPLDKNNAFYDYLKEIVICSWQGDEAIAVSNRIGWETTAVAGTTDSIMEGVVKATITVGNDVFEESLNVTILADHITEINITPREPSRNRVRFEYDSDEKAIYVDEGAIAPSSNTIQLIPTANMESKKVNISKGLLKWRVNDDTLANIVEQEDGSVLVRILKSGTIIVTATAEDVGKLEAAIVIEVRDYKPMLESKSFTVNKYSTVGVEIPAYEIEGNPITRILIDNSNFRVDKSNGKWMLTIINKDIYTSKTVLKTTMDIRTKMSMNLTAIPITITVETNKPKITFKVKTAPNVFFTDTEAVYTVSSSAAISNITKVRGQEITKGFEVTGYDSRKKLLTIKARGLSAENVSEFADKNSEICQVKVQVQYDGYGTIEETIKLSPQNKKPQYKIKEVSSVGAKDSYKTYLYNNVDKGRVTLGSDAAVTSLTDTVTADRMEDGSLTVRYSGSKTKSYKLSIRDRRWTSPIIFTGKISIVKSIATVLGKTSITLNMSHNMAVNGIVAVPVEAKNNTGVISNVEFAGVNNSTKKLLESGYLNISFNKEAQQIEAGLSETVPAGIKAGTYTIAVTGYLSQDDSELKLTKANLKVVLADGAKPPVVKLTGKGSINLADRENTSVIYTPKVTNMTASIKSISQDKENVTLTGQDAGYFTAKLLDNGRIEVKAKPDMGMRSGTNYLVGVRMKFDNNTEVTTTVKIKPVNKLPSIKASAAKATIYKVSANSVRWNVYNAGDFGSIESITVVDSKASANFDFKVLSSNDVIVSVKHEYKRTIKKGNYTISYQVKVKDAAVNAKPKTLKLTVTVK